MVDLQTASNDLKHHSLFTVFSIIAPVLFYAGSTYPYTNTSNIHTHTNIYQSQLWAAKKIMMESKK